MRHTIIAGWCEDFNMVISSGIITAYLSKMSFGKRLEQDLGILVVTN
jgi:hypothetical protein